MKPTLLPCPFCAAVGRLEHPAGAPHYHRVRCANGICYATTAPRPTVAEAVLVWNRRNGGDLPEESYRQFPPKD